MANHDDDAPDKTVLEPHTEMLAAIRAEAAARDDGSKPLAVPAQLVQPTNTTPDPPTSLGLRFEERAAPPPKDERYTRLEIAMIIGSVVLAAGTVVAVYLLR